VLRVLRAVGVVRVVSPILLDIRLHLHSNTVHSNSIHPNILYTDALTRNASS
jgi:hypothetical protein